MRGKYEATSTTSKNLYFRIFSGASASWVIDSRWVRCMQENTDLFFASLLLYNIPFTYALYVVFHLKNSARGESAKQWTYSLPVKIIAAGRKHGLLFALLHYNIHFIYAWFSLSLKIQCQRWKCKTTNLLSACKNNCSCKKTWTSCFIIFHYNIHFTYASFGLSPKTQWKCKTVNLFHPC